MREIICDCCEDRVFIWNNVKIKKDDSDKESYDICDSCSWKLTRLLNKEQYENEGKVSLVDTAEQEENENEDE